MIGKEAAATYISQNRRIFGHFCEWDNVSLCSYMITDYMITFVLIYHSRRVALSDVNVL